MKIGQKQPRRSGMSNLPWLAILLAIFVMGVALGDSGIYQTLKDAWKDTISSIDITTANDALPTLIVDMGFEAYENILDQRREALDIGVFISTESDFNPATIRLDNVEIPVRMRISQGPAIHLGEEDKWSFDVRTRNDQLLLGMQRFHLVDPADNNWFDELAFQRNLAHEGILSTQYYFVRLFFNGDDRGIYVVQEGFGSELTESQERPRGVIVEFDATRLWESIAKFGGNATAANDDPVTNLTAHDFQYFEVDAFRDATIARDELLSVQKERAIGLLRGLQSGELSAGEVFDTAQYGRFLALVDLWGATDGISLVNLRYYYNPQTDRLEPIGFNGNPLNSQSPDGGRLSLNATYNDPGLQTVYVQTARRVSRDDYLEQLQIDLNDELSALQQSLRIEVSHPLPWEALGQRQLQMQSSLNPVQQVFAYLGSPALAMSATIQIDVANVLNLPVEILGFDVGGATFLEADPEWVQNNPDDLLMLQNERVILRASVNGNSGALGYVRFHLPLTEIMKLDRELDTMREPGIQVATRILGLDQTELTVARPGYPVPLLDHTGETGDAND
jgi:hypothetical protein